VLCVIFDFIVGQRMDQDVKPLTVKHQPRHKIGRERLFPKDHLTLSDRVRSNDPDPQRYSAALLCGSRCHDPTLPDSGRRFWNAVPDCC
jgi:hypothetical protein